MSMLAPLVPTRLHIAIFWTNYVETTSKLWEARGVWVGDHTWGIFWTAYPFPNYGSQLSNVGLTHSKLQSNGLLGSGFQHISTYFNIVQLSSGGSEQFGAQILVFV